jgi:hypothetical protein
VKFVCKTEFYFEINDDLLAVFDEAEDEFWDYVYNKADDLMPVAEYEDFHVEAVDF